MQMKLNAATKEIRLMSLSVIFIVLEGIILSKPHANYT